MDIRPITQGGGLFETLIEDFSTLPKSAKHTKYEDYAVVNVGPSVVPNPYVPTFRIFSYNISEANVKLAKKRKHGHHRGDQGNKTTQCESEEYQDTWWCHLDKPWYSDSTAPSRSNGRLTPLGYAQVRLYLKHYCDVFYVYLIINQYYISGLGEANKTNPPQFELEYLTYRLDALHPDSERESREEFTYPVPPKLLPKSLRKPGATKSKYTRYKMKDLTIGSWIRFGRRLVDETKLQKRFRKYMFAGGEEG